MDKTTIINAIISSSSSIDFTIICIEKGIGLLTLNRPDQANAYNGVMLDMLFQKIHAIKNDQTIRAVIVTGKGDRAFCAGADKSELKNRRISDGLNLKSREVFDLWATLPVLTIAAINGAAIGGGLEFALACDVRVCSTMAKFYFPEVGMGLTPAAGGIARLPSIVGKGRAKEMILFGRELNATTSLEWGLVSYVDDDFLTKAMELATRGAEQDSLATTLAKRIMETDQNFSQHQLTSVVQALLYEEKFKKGHS